MKYRNTAEEIVEHLKAKIDDKLYQEILEAMDEIAYVAEGETLARCNKKYCELLRKFTNHKINDHERTLRETREALGTLYTKFNKYAKKYKFTQKDMDKKAKEETK